MKKENINILKTFKINKVMNESSDITLNTTIRKGIESNTYRCYRIKTDGVILSRYNGDEKESKIIGSTLTIVDDLTNTSSCCGTLLRSIRNSRKAYSEKWITEKDIKRVSERCHKGDINSFVSDNTIIIDGEIHMFSIIGPNIFGENILDNGFNGDSVIKTDGQIFEVDGRIYVRNASYIIQVTHDNLYLYPGSIFHHMYVDFDKATGQTIKNMRDDFRLAYHEGKRKFKI